MVGKVGGITKAFVQQQQAGGRAKPLLDALHSRSRSRSGTTASTRSFFSTRTSATDSISLASLESSCRTVDSETGAAGGTKPEDRPEVAGAKGAGSSTPSESEEDDEDEEPAYMPPDLSALSQAEQSLATTAAASYLAASHGGRTLGSEENSTVPRRLTGQTGSGGRLVARILPRDYDEYDILKPKWRIDPAELEGGRIVQGLQPGTDVGKEIMAAQQHQLELERRGSEGICDDVLTLSPTDGDGCRYDLAGKSDEDMIISLDLFLFRRFVPSFVSLQRSLHGHASSGVGSAGGSTGGDGSDDAGSVDSDDRTPPPKNWEEATVLDLHMNREATEMANRTLRRLEISTAKKLQIANPKSGNGKCCKKGKDRPANVAMQNRETASSVVVKTMGAEDDGWEWDDEGVMGDEGGGSSDGLTEMDLASLTSADLWRKVVTEYDAHPDQRSRIGVSLLNPDFSEEDGFDEGRIRLDVVSCPPTILKVQTFEDFEAQAFTGIPLVVETELIFASHAVVTWYVDNQVVLHDDKSYTPTEDDVGKTLSVLIVPTRPGHDGRGCEEAYRFKHTIDRLPFMPIVSPLRDGWTRTRTAEERNDLRVLTYNVLADLYTSRDIDQHLMYSHCDLRHLMRWRRMPMLIYEILAYQADVICLQEVDASVYDTLLRPVLGVSGYQSFYSNKASTQQEGCAMFWSTSCFDVAQEGDMNTVSIRDLFSEHEHLCDADASDGYDPRGGDESMKKLSKWDSMDEIIDLMGRHDELRRVTREKTGQILQVATLTLKKPSRKGDNGVNENMSKKPDKIVLANTHLFYHPMADHIRAIQAFVVCKKIDEVRRRDGSDPYPLVFCGDLNSDPLSGAVQLLFTRALPPEHHETWKHLHDYRWEMGDNEYMIEHGYVGNEDTVEEPIYIEEMFEDCVAHEDEMSLLAEASFGRSSTVHPIPIVLPSSFPNLVSGCPDMPEFTNFAVDFVETLDYVLASEPSDQERYGFGPKKAAPMPSEDEVKRYVAMPNEFMPSDHVSVVCDLQWQTEEKA